MDAKIIEHKSEKMVEQFKQLEWEVAERIAKKLTTLKHTEVPEDKELLMSISDPTTNDKEFISALSEEIELDDKGRIINEEEGFHYFYTLTRFHFAINKR